MLFESRVFLFLVESKIESKCSAGLIKGAHPLRERQKKRAKFILPAPQQQRQGKKDTLRHFPFSRRSLRRAKRHTFSPPLSCFSSPRPPLPLPLLSSSQRRNSVSEEEKGEREKKKAKESLKMRGELSTALRFLTTLFFSFFSSSQLHFRILELTLTTPSTAFESTARIHPRTLSNDRRSPTS